MVMWAMFAAPLEIAADLRRIPNASASILLNREVIAVQQASGRLHAHFLQGIAALTWFRWL